jgi:hypothetical protein
VGQSPSHANEGVLHQIVREIPIAGQQVGKPPRRIGVPEEQLLEPTGRDLAHPDLGGTLMGHGAHSMLDAFGPPEV